MLPVQGAEQAPGLIKFLATKGVVIEAAPDDPKADVRRGKIDAALVIPKDHGENFAAQAQGAVQTCRALNKADWPTSLY